jgi:hypothetical protein
VSMFAPAQRRTAKARIAIAGPSGAGKTYTALEVATGLADGGKIAVVDTERGSAALYAGDFSFDVAELGPPFSARKYHDALTAAADAGYAVVVIDSLTHAWKGEGGVLDEVDAAKARNRGGNDFSAWKDGDKLWRGLLDAILGAPIHVIVTLRSKQEWIIEEDSRGKKVPRKLGMAPEARDGIEYEFTLVVDVDHAHRAVVTKSRCRALADAVIDEPDRKVGETLLAWLNDGEPAPPTPRQQLTELLENLPEGFDVDVAKVEMHAAVSPDHCVQALDTLRARIAAWEAQRPEPDADADADASEAGAA